MADILEFESGIAEGLQTAGRLRKQMGDVRHTLDALLTTYQATLGPSSRLVQLSTALDEAVVADPTNEVLAEQKRRKDAYVAVFRADLAMATAMKAALDAV